VTSGFPPQPSGYAPTNSQHWLPSADGSASPPGSAAKASVSTTGYSSNPGTDTHQLLVRRSISKPTELAYYIVHTSTPVPLAELVRVAGSRWAVEETFQFTKNETGLDHYQVRKYHAWYRHITLSMLAAAFLTITAHTERLQEEKGATQPATNH
jgi:SRSO17 transposase